MTTSDPNWVWEPTDPRISGSSGDISKLFRNELLKNPGVLAADPPSDIATLMAREVIQNSADAASELQDELGDAAPEFEIDFEFEVLDGGPKRDLVRHLDLQALADRVSGPSSADLRAKLGLSRTDCLNHLDSEDPLRVLRITERGTTGMYGPFTGANSKMYLALISLGYTVKAAGSGGSYGYGKAGLIRGSAVRTVIAYTRFRERLDDPGITRRLLGMTYWGSHEFAGAIYTGFARYGEQVDGAVIPFVDHRADEVAARLGLDLRDPEDDDDLGTTFLLIDPVPAAVDLVGAIERNWWPAIEDGRLSATVIDGADRMVPRPRRDPVLQPFIEAYDLALSAPDNQVAEKKRTELSAYEHPGGGRYELGSLGLVAEPGGWSYAADDPDGDDDVALRSLVVLVWAPRMIVEYLEAGAARPYVRGVFVADDAADDLLRQTEPKAHDAWQTRMDEGGIDPVAPVIAKTILDRVKRNVNDFRKSLKPPPRPAEDIRLPELEKLFRSLFTSKGGEPPTPPQGERPFSIKVHQRVIESDLPMHICLEGSVRFALSEDRGSVHESDAELTVSYRIVEEGGNGEEIGLMVVPPRRFVLVGECPYSYRGRVTHEYAEFSFVSVPYPADWTGKLKADAELLEPAPTADDETALE